MGTSSDTTASKSSISQSKDLTFPSDVDAINQRSPTLAPIHSSQQSNSPATPLKAYRTKQLVLCALLSLVVHVGLAATFINAVQQPSSSLLLPKPIQVTLVQQPSEFIGNAISDSNDSSPEKGSIQGDIGEELEQSENASNSPESSSIETDHPATLVPSESRAQQESALDKVSEITQQLIAKETPPQRSTIEVEAVTANPVERPKNIVPTEKPQPTSLDKTALDRNTKDKPIVEPNQNTKVDAQLVKTTDPIPIDRIPDEQLPPRTLYIEQPTDFTKQLAQFNFFADVDSAEVTLDTVTPDNPVASLALDEPTMLEDFEPIATLIVERSDHSQNDTAPAIPQAVADLTDTGATRQVNSLPLEHAMDSNDDWDQVSLARITNYEALEDTAYTSPTSSVKSITEPVRIASIDFDQYFETWIPPKQTEEIDITAITEPEPTFSQDKSMIELFEDTDQIAGILPSAEYDENPPQTIESQLTETTTAPTVPVYSDIQIASITDFDALIQQLAQPEINVINVEDSDRSNFLTPTEQAIVPDSNELNHSTKPVTKSSTDWDQVSLAWISTFEALEDIADPNSNPTSPVMPINEPVITAFIDFDQHFEPWTPTEQVEEMYFTRQTESEQKTSLEEVLTERSDDADRIAGILPSVENQEESPPTHKKSITEADTTAPVPVHSATQLASITDFDALVQQLPQPEFDIAGVQRSDSDSNVAPAERVPSPESEPSNDPIYPAKSPGSPPKVKPSETLLVNLSESEPQLTDANKLLNKLQPLESDLPLAERQLTKIAETNTAPQKSTSKASVQPTQRQLAATLPTALNDSQKKQQTSENSQQQAALAGVASEIKPKFGVKGLPNPAPRYPYKSRARGEEGKVILRVVVNRKGRADEITVFQSSGYSRLDKAATKAVRKWRFRPAEKNGLTARGVVQVPISFVLEKS